jgi:hypothetical protein
MSADNNLLSFNGPADNDRSVDMREAVIEGAGYSDAVKCSKVENFRGYFGEVRSGTEDAADVNNECRNVFLAARLWALSGKIGFTVKGGSKTTTLAGQVQGHGKSCDVEIGGWSDQSNDKTEDTRLNLWRADGAPIRIRLLHGDRPRVYGSPHEYVFPSPELGFLHPVIVWFFMKLRRLGFFR